jgi:hypothetical protein
VLVGDSVNPMYDGTAVIIKTTSHPNKAIVVYATILGSSPKESVCGVEIGKQFYKVQINHLVVQDEPLVRPMPSYDKIGDAHTKGATIAWPSLCVCYNKFYEYIMLHIAFSR